MKQLFRIVISWLKSTRSTVWCMKYLPLIGTILMTIHCALLLNGIEWGFVEFLVGFPMSSMLMFFLLSKQFKFCKLHKHLIGYVAVMDICIYLQEKDVWGVALTPARWVMLIIGCILISWALVKFLVSGGKMVSCGD